MGVTGGGRSNLQKKTLHVFLYTLPFLASFFLIFVFQNMFTISKPEMCLKISIQYNLEQQCFVPFHLCCVKKKTQTSVW